MDKTLYTMYIGRDLFDHDVDECLVFKNVTDKDRLILQAMATKYGYEVLLRLGEEE